MRRVFWLAAAALVLLISAFGAVAIFPQLSEKIIEMTCSMTNPDAGCRRRMVAMGHVWAAKYDLERALLWYARVADLGEPDAMFHLAWAYHASGFDDVRSFARNVGNSEADPDRLADALTRSFRLADKWYRNAAEKGFAPAMNNLGELAVTGVLGGERKLDEAFAWYLAAARAGNPVGAMNVSLAYRIGEGVIQDTGEAQRWAEFVPAIDSPDLDDVTLSRTTLHGSNVDAKLRSTIRNAAVEHKAIGVTFEPLKQSARIPTFHNVSRELSPTPNEPTLKDLQR